MSEKRKIIKNNLMRKYRLIIRNENKTDKELGFKVSPFGIIVSLFVSLMLVVGTVYLIFALTPVAEYLPGHVSDKTREQLVGYALAIDSLQEEVYKQEQYINNVKAILEGNIEYPDTAISTDTLYIDNELRIESSAQEQEFISEFEEKEKYNLTSYASSIGSLQGINFYQPTQGMIIKSFDPKNGHYGVDIAENPDESVVAIWDGTVIMSDYTANDGYTIMLQHNEELVSVYRNCHRLTKKVGDKVNAGETIAISGAKNEETEDIKPFLHLELWHSGQALDPNIYIAF